MPSGGQREENRGRGCTATAACSSRFAAPIEPTPRGLGHRRRSHQRLRKSCGHFRSGVARRTGRRPGALRRNRGVPGTEPGKKRPGPALSLRRHPMAWRPAQFASGRARKHWLVHEASAIGDRSGVLRIRSDPRGDVHHLSGQPGLVDSPMTRYVANSGASRSRSGRRAAMALRAPASGRPLRGVS